MRLHSSSTSNFRLRQRNARARAFGTLIFWTILWLVALDVGVGLVFRYPMDVAQRPTELQQYFEYGRSIEGKIKRLISSDDAHAAPIASAGWLAGECGRSISAVPDGASGVTVYGMSFSNHVAKQLESLDTTIRTTTRSGPGATLNHSYACFRMIEESGEDHNAVQVIGILASTVERMLTLSAMTTSFEAPTPYAYPRYTVDAQGRLLTERPLAESPRDLRDPMHWARFKAQLEASDAFFDALTMDETPADGSVLVRMLRRAYAQHSVSARGRELVGGDPSFVANPDVGPVLEALLLDFATRVRARRQIPIVLLIQDRPGIDALERLLAPALRTHDIPFVSTAGIVSTTDPSNFISDGHFTEAGDRRVAQRTLAVMRDELRKVKAHLSAD